MERMASRVFHGDWLPAAGAVLPRPERRQLTIMFCDIVGSTELSGRLDPEDLRELIIGRLHGWSRIIERHRGYVARYMGDGLLAYFGYPLGRPGDAERAARAALELVESCSGTRAGAHGVRIAVRVGIATGTVVVGGVMGRGRAREEPVFGFTPNLAARLQGVAAPNATVISEETRRLIQGAFHCEALGSLELKGVAQPVAAWRLLGSRAGRLAASCAGSLLPVAA